ncbi:sugar transporter ERD6-like 7 [Bidens hawaiensis]|uniref:sugar transporter ERD6-like 7 n=1 Tax=Bidens hawaiensis TaxID=980011 RepID=UPI004048FCE4
MAQDDMHTPLVTQTIDGNHESNFMVYLTTFVALCGSFAFGSCAGYSSPTQSSITQDLNLSLAEYSLFGSILTFGAMIGAITSGPIADFVGRKGALRISSIFCLTGWLAIYLAKGIVVLDMGRLATGYAMGVFSYVVPVFIAEIAPKNLRGRLTATNQTFEIIVPNNITNAQAKTGNQKEFHIALRKLRGKDADISEEADEIQDYIETLEKLPKTKLLDLFQRRYSRSIIIGVGLMVCQQFGGINGICFYTRFPGDLGTIIYALVQIVITALNALFLDKAGRKPLLLVSATGLVLGCLTTALSFYLKTYEIGLSAVPALAITGILVYIVSFSAGMGAIPWVIMSKVFPINIKGAAGSLATLVNWFGAWVVSFTFNFLLSWSSYGKIIGK